MDRLIWSPRAAAELQEICEYIERDSPEYARIVARRIVQVAESIPRFPRAGRIVPEWQSPDLRERIVGNYRLIYRILPAAVEIVTVVHGARRLHL